MTSSTIVVTAIRVTHGTGAVTVINADGVAPITAPNQPYFAYDQIVAAGANSTQSGGSSACRIRWPP